MAKIHTELKKSHAKTLKKNRAALYGKTKDGESCKGIRNGRYGQACCPHAKPNSLKSPYGYAKTYTPHILSIPNGEYKGTYHLMTCCQMCGDSMNAQAAADHTEFANKYIAKRLNDGALVLKNQHTKKPTQIVYPITKTTKRNKRHTIKRRK